MSKIPDSLSVPSAQMLTAAAAQVRELVGSVRKDGQKFKLAYDGLSAGIDAASEAEIKKRIGALRDAGYSQFTIQLVPGHESALADWARIRKAFA